MRCCRSAVLLNVISRIWPSVISSRSAVCSDRIPSCLTLTFAYARKLIIFVFQKQVLTSGKVRYYFIRWRRSSPTQTKRRGGPPGRTTWSRYLPEKLTGSQLVKKFPSLYGTQRVITTFTSALQVPIFWTRSIEAMAAPLTTWRSMLILFFHLCLGLPCGLLPSGLPPPKRCIHLSPPYVLHYPPSSLFLITRMISGEEERA